MKKAFYFGFGVALLLLILGYFTKNTHLYGTIALGIGIFFLAIGGLVSGAFIDGRQLRVNYATESKDDREKRRKVMFVSGIMMLPNLIAGALLLSV